MIGLIIFFIVAGIVLTAANLLVIVLDGLFGFIVDKLESKCKNPIILYTLVSLMCVVPIATTYFIVDNYAKY